MDLSLQDDAHAQPGSISTCVATSTFFKWAKSDSAALILSNKNWKNWGNLSSSVPSLKILEGTIPHPPPPFRRPFLYFNYILARVFVLILKILFIVYFPNTDYITQTMHDML